MPTAIEKQDSKTISNLDKILRKALYQQSAINKHLHKASKALIQVADEEQQTYRIKRLILQYRLDNEDVLQSLLKLHTSLCQAIGIEPMNSARVNLENAANAVGLIGLKEELSMLGHLLEQLEKTYDDALKLNKKRLAERKIIDRLLKKLKGIAKSDDSQYDLEDAAHLARTQKYSRTQGIVDSLEHELHGAVELQAYFQFNVAQLTEAYQAFEGLPKFGIIYDYLCGLQGPISRFFMAQQNGLNLINNLSLQYSTSLGIDKYSHIKNTRHYMQQLINKTQNILSSQKMLNQEQHNRLSHLRNYENEMKLQNQKEPALQSTKTDSNQAALEHDRIARRTMPFFNHTK